MTYYRPTRRAFGRDDNQTNPDDTLLRHPIIMFNFNPQPSVGEWRDRSIPRSVAVNQRSLQKVFDNLSLFKQHSRSAKVISGHGFSTLTFLE